MKTIRMISAFLLAALVLVTTSCASKSETPAVTTTQNAETPAPTETQPAPEVEKLPFLNDGEIYVELKLDSSVKNASVSLDGTKLSGNKTAFKNGMKFTLNGDFAADASVNIIVVYTKGSKNAAEANVEFKKGVDVEMVSEIVTKCLNRSESTQRVFVSLFEKDGTWDKSLSEEMNKFIVGMYPALK